MNLGIEIEHLAKLNLAATQAGATLVRSLRLTNGGQDDLHDLHVTICADPPFAAPLELRIDAIRAGMEHVLAPVELLASVDFLARQTERVLGRLSVDARCSAGVATKSTAIEVLAPTEWLGVSVLPELLAAFVRPNSAVIAPLLKDAANRLDEATADPSLSGYQARDPRRVARIVQALYECLQARGVSYANPPASFEAHGQKVRTHEQVLQGGLGTCLDFTVLLSALAEAAGLNAFVVAVQGHAFPGVWLTDWRLPGPTLDDPLPIRKRVELGEALVFDSSLVAQRGSFEDAVRIAEGQLADVAAFRLAVDVAASRAAGIRPLPLDHVLSAPDALLAADVVPITPRVSSLSGDRFRYADAVPSSAPRSSDRLQRWKARLLDLTLRNRLLNFREGPKTVPLRGLDLAELEDAIMRGATLELRPKPSLPATATANVQQAYLREAQAKGRLHVSLAPAELDARLLELYRSSRSALEDSGAALLYVAIGFLKWFESPTSTEPRLAPLLLVPARLTRPSHRGVWQLSAEDEEPRINVTLLQKLRTDFGLESAGLDSPPTDDAGLDVARILHDVRRLVLEQARWEVLEEAQLGLFSFAKFLMWLDLEARRDTLLANPLVAHIVEGKGKALPLASPLVPEDTVEHARPAAEVLSVVDADPSQLRAIFAADDGSSFVLQGPPGTGKSQTITNLIAQLLAKGKTVLFVSEKMAALEVVQRRLTQVGLGPFCLELHSHQASRKAVAAQIGKSFEVVGSAPPSGWAAHAESLARARQTLNAYAEALANPSPFRPEHALPGSAERQSVRAALASLFALDDAPKLEFPTIDPASLSAESVDRLEAVTRDAVIAIEDAGAPPTHPWRGVRQTEWSPAWDGQVRALVAELATSTPRLRELISDASSVLGAGDVPQTPAGIEAVVATASCVVTSPEPSEAMLALTGASDRLARLDEWIAQGKDLVAKRDQLAMRWQERLFELDLDTLAARYARFRHSFWLVAFLALWGARRVLKTVAAQALPAREVVASDLDLARSLRGLARALDHDADARAWLGAKWRGARSDWDALIALRRWLERFQAAARRLVAQTGASRTAELAARLSSTDAATVAPGSRGHQVLTDLVTSWNDWSRKWQELVGLLQLDEAELLGPTPDLSRHEAAVHAWQAEHERLRGWCAIATALNRLDTIGLGPLANALRSGVVTPERATRTLDRSLRQAWWDAKLAVTPELAQFRGSAHQEQIRAFRELDEKAVEYARKECVARLAARIPDIHGPGDELALLRRQLQLQRGHQPTRKLMATIPTTIRRIKPCMLMSPLSVAQYLDPTLPPFDVVVFDEASQIPPWDAIGAIARGRQVVVVGDSRQLPPTSFFERTVGAEDAGIADDESLEELESILDETVASGFPQIRLRWHYRSKHESLIAFSNHHYYENNLLTFPSADHGADLRGVELRKVNGVYDRGGSRTNQAEARAVVDELIRILSAPEGVRRSVGVVTFNQTQQRLVQDLLDEALASRPELQRFLTDAVQEPVFVKNLENVQGDERDIMLMSVGYAKDRSGVITMNFGPLNRLGGERRLNVAVTRARERLIVFATLHADQIDLDRTRAIGAAHLRSFLRYAEQGVRALDAETSAPTQHTFESPFEKEICEVLTRAGYLVHTQIGCSGYRVDLGIVHPDRPGTYLCGIECDGATYHNSRSARERDRLRQQVLESLGWRILRVWSTDFWYSRREQSERLLRAIELLQTTSPGLADAPRPAARTEPEPVHLISGPSIQERLAAGPTAPALPDHVTKFRLPEIRGGQKDDFTAPQNLAKLAKAVENVVSLAGPLPKHVAYRAIANAWGFGSLGKRIAETLDTALASIPPHRRPLLQDDFLWPPTMRPDQWQSFRVPANGASARPAEEIATEEVANAAAWVLEQGVAMSRDALIKETAKVLGYERVATKVEARMALGIDRLIATGRALADGNKVRVG